MDGPKVEETPVEDIKPQAHPMDRLEDEIICAVCMEYFDDPVIIQCGHNFCESCILCFWDNARPDPSCPRGCSIQDKLIQPNLPLANVTRIAQELSSLLGKKEDKGEWILCINHLEPMKLFCKEDEALICVVCRESQSHRAHHVLPIEEAVQECKDQIKTHLEGIKKTQEVILKLLFSGQEEGENMLNQTRKEMEGAQAEFNDLHRFLDKEESFLVSRLETINIDITKKKTEYAAELKGAVALHDSFIEEMEEKCQQPPDEFLHDIKSFLKRCKEKEQQKFGNLEAFWTDFKQEIFGIICQIGLIKIIIDHFKGTLSSAQKFKKAENMTLDPDTAHPVLLVSKDRKCVEWATKWKTRPDNSLRFESEPCVVGSSGFTSGIWYWVVEIEKDEGGCAFGVAKEAINRKSIVSMNPESGVWSLTLTGNCSMVPNGTKNPTKIQVWVDFEKQHVGFIDADTNIPIRIDVKYSFFGEKMYPWFKVGNGSVLRLW